ncbi:MAG: endolytic transglycosylase MltG, partial [Myxococcota bacterium]|nr:endolytic transglycosylase MltG [Myxococcota bacterium]
ASGVAREDPKDANMPVFAGVLWKRLDNRWNLGVDATSRYTLEVWNDRRAFLGKLRDSSDPYNTRLRSGLPPTPIGSPGLQALKASLAPQGSGYWYYLHDSKGQIHLSRSAKEHEAFRKRYNVY